MKGELFRCYFRRCIAQHVNDYRTIEADGIHSRKRSKIIDKAEATLEVVVKEITAEEYPLS